MFKVLSNCSKVSVSNFFPLQSTFEVTLFFFTIFFLQDFPVFWPLRDSDFELETFRVRFVDEAVHEGHSTLDFVVSSQHDDYELAVRIIHCPDWSHSISKVQQCFNVLKLVQDWHLEYQDGPLVVVDK